MSPHHGGLGRQGEHPYGDLGQIICLIVFLIVWVLDSFLFKYSIFLSAYISVYIRAAAAALALILSVYMIRSGHRAVSHDASDSPPQLITDGAFGRMRHPIYLAALLFYIILIVITLSLISLFLFIGIIIFYGIITRFEEKFLEKQFGQEYLDYKKKVPKWIPRIF
jgi:protein-S-isoprenylcysteine O-methyltransferase Ste14